jgi:hypothetical protein
MPYRDYLCIQLEETGCSRALTAVCPVEENAYDYAYARAALVPYFIQNIRAATDTNRQCPPEYQQAVANIEEVR